MGASFKILHMCISLWISSGSPLLTSRTNENASCGHLATQMPQPMQATVSTTARRWSTEIALNWQVSAQVPQPVHRSGSTLATYPEEANIGVPLFQACMALQQQAQQLQMAWKRPSMASLYTWTQLNKSFRFGGPAGDTLASTETKKVVGMGSIEPNEPSSFVYLFISGQVPKVPRPVSCCPSTPLATGFRRQVDCLTRRVYCSNIQKS